MKYVPLPAICRLRQWPTIPQKEMSGHGYPVYGANGIIGYHSEYNHENPTLFIGCRGTCGSVHRSSPKSYINGNAMCLDDLKSSYSAKFVFYFLKGYDWKKVITGTGIPQITQQGLQKVLIPELSLEEQSEIANALELIDEQSKHCAKQINLLEEQVKSLFNDFLTSSEYPLQPLETTCEIITGNTPPRSDKENYGSYIEWIKSDNISDAKYPSTAEEFLSEKGCALGRSAPADSILMVCIAGSIKSIGRCALLNRRACFNQQINALIPKRYEPVFLLYLLRYEKKIFEESIHNALKGILSKSALASIELPVLPLPPTSWAWQRPSTPPSWRPSSRSSFRRWKCSTA